MTIRPSMTLLQRLKQRPFEFAFAVILLITAATTVAAGGGIITTHLSPLMAVLWSALNLAGGVFVLTGLLWRRSTIMGRALETVGWFIESVTLAAVIAALTYFVGWSAIPGLLEEVVYVAAMLLRCWFLHGEKRAERAAIAILRRHKREEGDA